MALYSGVNLVFWSIAPKFKHSEDLIEAFGRLHNKFMINSNLGRIFVLNSSNKFQLEDSI